VRSTHIAALVGRSRERTNNRLSRLFHAGYIDRPRAQLDYYPTSGSAPMVYALADGGAKLLGERLGAEFAHIEWSRINQDAGRPFIEHQLEIVDFYVALELAVRGRSDVRLIHSDELIAAFPEQTRAMRNPLALRVSVSHNETMHDIGLVPDFVFGLMYPNGARRCIMDEIDRGTMPISRSDLTQTSFERKMRAYLAAHVARQHEQQFGWKTFRVLTVTTDKHRARSMTEALRQIDVPGSPGPGLFFFALRDELRTGDPLVHAWQDGNGREVRLL
jgi:DNA-binding Lrp family transcriptional regulator